MRSSSAAPSTPPRGDLLEVGAVDARGRAYNAALGTLKRKVMSPEGALTLGPGEAVKATSSLEVTLLRRSGRGEQPILLPSRGEFTVTTHRLFFLVGEAVDRGELPTLLNVEIAAPPTAVAYFFRQGGGREFLEIALPEVRGVKRGRDAVMVRLRARWPAETEGEFDLRLAPRGEAERLLGPLAA